MLSCKQEMGLTPHPPSPLDCCNYGWSCMVQTLDCSCFELFQYFNYKLDDWGRGDFFETIMESPCTTLNNHSRSLAVNWEFQLLYMHIASLYKVDVPNLVICLNQTPTLEWCVVRCGLKKGAPIIFISNRLKYVVDCLSSIVNISAVAYMIIQEESLESWLW